MGRGGDAADAGKGGERMLEKYWGWRRLLEKFFIILQNGEGYIKFVR